MTVEAIGKRSPIDPDLKRYLDGMAPPASSEASDDERARMGRALMLQAVKSRSSVAGLPNGVQTSEVAITAGLKGRMYVPSEAATPKPILVYAHGGGWVAGSIETHDPFCRLLSEAGRVMVLSVEYRLAPEHPFPAALQDMAAAYGWAADHAERLGGDPKLLLLGGDSAGANLAAVTANRICATDEVVRPGALMLLYPVTDHPGGEHASYRENAAGYGLDANLMRWFWKQYARDTSPGAPDLSPLRLERVPALPRTLVATAEYDPLRDEGIAYAEKLVKAGVAMTHLHAPDMHHNFPVHPGTVGRFPQSIAALNDFGRWLQGARE